MIWFCKGIEGPLLPTINFPELFNGNRRTVPARKRALGWDIWELISVGVLPAMWSWADHWNSLKLTNLLCKMLLTAKQEFQFGIITCEIKIQMCYFIYIQILLHIDIGTYTEIYKYIHILYLYFKVYSYIRHIFIPNFVFTCYKYIPIYTYFYK